MDCTPIQIHESIGIHVAERELTMTIAEIGPVRQVVVGSGAKPRILTGDKAAKFLKRFAKMHVVYRPDYKAFTVKTPTVETIGLLVYKS